MMNYIIKLTYSLTQSHTPGILNPTGPPSTDNATRGTKKLLLKIQVGEDFAQ